jgi:hypothetical protein
MREIQKKQGSAAIVIILVVLVAAVGLYFMYMQPVADDGTAAKDTTSTLLVGENAIYVATQHPDEHVHVSMSVLKSGGYVVVHANNEGKPGSILGNSSLLPAGGSENFDVELSRSSKDGEIMHAMLHMDNGDGIFNAADDAPIKDIDGNIIMMQFSVSKDAEEPADNSL